MKNITPGHWLALQAFLHGRCAATLVFNEVVLYAEDVEPLFETFLLFCECSCFAYEAADAFAEFAAEAINDVDGDLVVCPCAIHTLVRVPEHFLVFASCFFAIIVHVVEVLFDGGDVLVVAIAHDDCFARSCWKAQSRCEHRVEPVTCVIVPFSNDKTNKELCVSFYGEVGVRVADFACFARVDQAVRFFFFIKLHISSTSIGVSCSSRTKYSLYCLQCFAIVLATSRTVSK